MENLDTEKIITRPLKYGFRKAFIQNVCLPLEARFLLILLMSFKGKNKDCWPSQRKLATVMGRSKDTVHKYLNILRKEGYLSVKTRGIGRSLLYAPSYWKISAGGDDKSTEIKKPAEISTQEPAETTPLRSISSGNKEKVINENEGIEQVRRKLIQLGLKKPVGG